MQLNALRTATRSHKQVTVSNNPGIIYAPVQNPMEKTSKGWQLTSKGSQPTSGGVNSTKETSAEVCYSQLLEKRNNRMTNKRHPKQRYPRLHPIKYDKSPGVEEN